MNKMFLFCIVFIAVLFLNGCAAGINTAVHTAAFNEGVAGFWLGIWHGLISPITLIISLFTDNVSMYEVHNSGGGYNFGFIIGAAILFYICETSVIAFMDR